MFYTVLAVIMAVMVLSSCSGSKKSPQSGSGRGTTNVRQLEKHELKYPAPDNTDAAAKNSKKIKQTLKRNEKQKEKQAKEAQKAQKEAAKRHREAQSKDTLKRMDENKKKSEKNNRKLWLSKQSKEKKRKP